MSRPRHSRHLEKLLVFDAAKADGSQAVHGRTGQWERIVLRDLARSSRDPPTFFGRLVPASPRSMIVKWLPLSIRLWVHLPDISDQIHDAVGAPALGMGIDVVGPAASRVRACRIRLRTPRP